MSLDLYIRRYSDERHGDEQDMVLTISAKERLAIQRNKIMQHNRCRGSVNKPRYSSWGLAQKLSELRIARINTKANTRDAG